MGTCTEFRHFGYAQCIATLNYREVEVLGIGEENMSTIWAGFPTCSAVSSPPYRVGERLLLFKLKIVIYGIEMYRIL
ncbi:MAG: hypothetical protein V7K50_24255 [Nostoc sp.]|uniref:hypothetical protein n=1 Tax=Nostoc sp. TaxID=1180 RepID=UPI002FF48242